MSTGKDLTGHILFMDRAHSLAVVFLIAAILLALVILFYSPLKDRVRRIPAVIGILFASLAAFVCILSSSMGTLVFLPSESPDQAAEEFMRALSQRNEEAASSMLAAKEELFFVPQGNDEEENLCNEALKYSFSYELLDECERTGTSATQKVRLTYLDFNKPVSDIYDTLFEELEQKVENRKKSEVYDENNNYRPEILEEVYSDSIKKVLSKPDAYCITADCSLLLTYRDGEWKVTADDALKLALSGNTPAGMNASNRLKSEVLKDLTYIPKTYKLPEDATAGPKPNPDKYGSTDNPEDILNLMASCPLLTDGKEPFFSADSEFIGKDILYYADDTILTVTWKEKCQGHFCTFSEVYIADPSQFRRKLSADTFGSSVQKFATELSKETNAVVAMNGDFYRFRNEGMTVYQRKLYRFNPFKLDICHVDAFGNLKFSHGGDLKKPEEAEQYIKDNNILFSMCFGPVLVENYEPQTCPANYLLGQVTSRYSRSCLSQRGDCHYLLMTLNHGHGCPTATIDELRNVIVSKNVENSYTLDGGQTGEIIMQHKVLNQIDFDTERTVSDILYFVTAIPEDENE